MRRSRDECLRLAVSQVVAQPVHSIPKEHVLCWHCCHSFDGLGFELPIAYDERRDTFKTLGRFCSFSCCKAYNYDTAAGRKDGDRSNLLSLMKKKITGKLTPTIPAPPRCCLRAFGGTMTIEEFRSKSDQGIIVSQLPLKMVPLETIIHERKIEAKKAAIAPGPNLRQEVDLTTTVAKKNETLRLKRPRPMPSNSDVLARTMGLEFFPTG